MFSDDEIAEGYERDLVAPRAVKKLASIPFDARSVNQQQSERRGGLEVMAKPDLSPRAQESSSEISSSGATPRLVEPAHDCQFTKAPQSRPCAEVHPMMHAKWCGACLMQHYDPERFAREVEALRAALVSPDSCDRALALLRDICESAGPAGFRHDAASSVIATTLVEDARAFLDQPAALVEPSPLPIPQEELPADAAQVLRDHAWELYGEAGVEPSPRAQAVRQLIDEVLFALGGRSFERVKEEVIAELERRTALVSPPHDRPAVGATDDGYGWVADPRAALVEPAPPDLMLKPNEQAKRGRCKAQHPTVGWAICGRWKGHGGPHREMGYRGGPQFPYDQQWEEPSSPDAVDPVAASHPTGPRAPESEGSR